MRRHGGVTTTDERLGVDRRRRSLGAGKLEQGRKRERRKVGLPRSGDPEKLLERKVQARVRLTLPTARDNEVTGKRDKPAEIAREAPDSDVAKTSDFSMGPR